MSTNPRQTEAAVHRQFVERWSPRAFSDRPVSPEDAQSLFEAARWAPSCYNDQPWHFVWATSESGRARLAELLVEGNRVWAAKAPLLGIVFARKAFGHNGQPNRWAQFDAGAAAFSMTLQAQELGLATHLMGGFDAGASYEALGVSADEYEAMAAFAVGYRGDAGELPGPLQERESPSGRKPLAEVARQID